MTISDCRHLAHELVRYGSTGALCLWCPTCCSIVTMALGAHGGQFLPKDHPSLVGLDVSRVREVGTITRRACAICLHITDTELHHWCVQALYRDAGSAAKYGGPTDWLCRPCHEAWHRIVTPGLVGGMTIDGAKTFLRALYKRLGDTGWSQFVRVVTDADAGVRARLRPPTPDAPHADAA